MAVKVNKNPAKLSTVKELKEYLDFHIDNGRADYVPMLDQRGLSFIKKDNHGCISLSIPFDNDTHNDGKVFVRAIY